MHLRILAAAVCLALFCSCNAVTLSGTESLLVAPKLNKKQTDVSLALESTLNLRNITYKYPNSGEYRSPFVFHDLDGDGVEEAVVFYAFLSDSAGNVRAQVLSQGTDGKWFPLEEVAAQDGRQVDFIQFRHLLDSKASCMIIGWKGSGRQSSVLTIYSLSDGAFQLEVSQEYSRYAVQDFDGDGLGELVVISREGAQGRHTVSLLRAKNGHIEPVGSLLLAEDVDTTLSLTCGRLWDSGAVYIDEILADGPISTTATEVIQVGAAGLTLLAGGEATPPGEPEPRARVNYVATFRDEDILSADYNQDGEVEVPNPVTLPGAPDDTDTSAPKLTNLMRLTPDGFDIQSSAVINSEAGYLFYFPERWYNAVTVERDVETGEWRFRKWNSETSEPAEDLLRIRASTAGGYRDVFEEYIELGARGTTLYSAQVPSLPGEPLALTAEEAKTLFLQLPI